MLMVILMTGFLIYLNYWHGLEIRFVQGGHTKLEHFTGYYLLYGLPFITAFLLQYFFYQDTGYWRKPWFIAILVLSPAFFSFRVNFDLQEQWVTEHFSGRNLMLYLHSINWITRVFVVLLPVVLVWWLKDRNNQPFYGSKRTASLIPYWWMLLIMFPLIALASTQPDFLQMYPKARLIRNGDHGILQYMLFEASYGFDFISIEFFFRGFLILSLAELCGKHCIIPMACFYCTIHFGKPMGEAISSFWGGLLLGIISYHTRSIWGGLLVHLGIAWLMEIGGWLGSHFFVHR